MNGTFKKEKQPEDISLKHVLKRGILTSLALVIGLGIGIQLLTSETASQEAPQQTNIVLAEAEPVQETIVEPEASVEVVEPTWRDNPNNCDQETQYIREDNLECLDKPKPRQKPAPVVAKDTPTASASASSTYSGNKQTWLAASGIPESEWWAVDFIVSRESGWNPCAYFPGKSNCNLTAEQVNKTCSTYYNGKCAVACGIGQSLPCGKWGSNWTDPVNQLKNQYSYVKSRYGGYPQAVNYWRANGHY